MLSSPHECSDNQLHTAALRVRISAGQREKCGTGSSRTAVGVASQVDTGSVEEGKRLRVLSQSGKERDDLVN